MNQEIKILGRVIMIFTWFSDGLVYVKYFLKDEQTELESFEQIPEYLQKKINKERLKFDEDNKNLIMYSY